MAKIKTDLVDGQAVTITRAGETRRRHISHGGILTVRNDEAADVIRRLPGSTLVEGSLDDPDDDDPDSPPDLPAPPPLT